MIPRFPLRFALWLNPGESPFKMDTEHLLWFAEFIKQAEKGSNEIRSRQLRTHRTQS